MNVKGIIKGAWANGLAKKILILLGISLIIFVVGVLIGSWVLGEKTLGWKGFLSGYVVFAILFISAMINVFKNTTESMREGKKHVDVRGHILVLGAGHQLKSILRALKGDKRPIVVMSRRDIDGHFIHYKKDYENEEDLLFAGALLADRILVIGEDGPERDSRNLHCIEVLRALSEKAMRDIHCHVLLSEPSTSEVLWYLKAPEKATGHLLVDVFNEYEFMSEQLLVGTDFLPTIREADNQRLHVVLIGTGPIAQAVAFAVANVCHYPNFKRTNLKTCITFVDEDCEKWVDRLVVSRMGLFRLSKYTYVDANGNKVVHDPETVRGDYLDVEWNFVDSYCEGDLARNYIAGVASSPKERLVVCICKEDASKAISTLVHLPRAVYENADIAVYWREANDDIIKRINESGMYGYVRIMGDIDEMKEFVHSRRVERGQRANYVRERHLNPETRDTEEKMWYRLSEADKTAAIYCANALPLRKRCFSVTDDESLLRDAEHRRWMMSMLLMGYSSGPTDEKRFMRHDIIPYDRLPEDLKFRDAYILENSEYIING
jgi:hypothetical protein